MTKKCVLKNGSHRKRLHSVMLNRNERRGDFKFLTRVVSGELWEL